MAASGAETWSLRRSTSLGCRQVIPSQPSRRRKPEEERLFTGLRLTKGVRLTAVEWQRHREPIKRFLEAGLLEGNAEALRLTRRGVLLSNEVFQEFLAA